MSHQHWFITWNTRSSSNIHKYIKHKHFIYLQEVTQEVLLEETKKLNDISSKKFYQTIYDTGNGIITCLPIINNKTGSLDVGHGSEEDTYIRVCIDLSSICSEDKINHLNIVCVQLDKNNEETRMEQLKLITPVLEKSDILMGDLNSLNFSDYSSVEIEAINKKRVKNEQEEANNKVINYLKSLDYIPRTPTGSSPYTTQEKTRVDYIIIRQNRNVFYMFDEIIVPKTKINNDSKRSLVVCLIHKTGRSFVL